MRGAMYRAPYVLSVRPRAFGVVPDPGPSAPGRGARLTAPRLVDRYREGVLDAKEHPVLVDRLGGAVRPLLVEKRVGSDDSDGLCELIRRPEVEVQRVDVAGGRGPALVQVQEIRDRKARSDLENRLRTRRSTLSVAKNAWRLESPSEPAACE